VTDSTSRLLTLLREHSVAKKVLSAPHKDLGLSEEEPFPFLAIVGQDDLKLALLLTVINPAVGGVLLLGARGTAKTTAVRALVDILPFNRRSLCQNGCTEEILDKFGLEGICASCAQRIGYGEALTVEDRVRIIELPLNAELEDVIGGANERLALEQKRLRLERGLLAQAEGNVLYIDEVNLLDERITDAVLDAAAQGYFTVRRGPLNLKFRSHFIIIGSMNPEEGQLRPQIMDRFGLRVIVRGLDKKEQRFLAYQQAMSYLRNPDGFSARYAEQTLELAEEVQRARQRLSDVSLTSEAIEMGLDAIKRLDIQSNRAENTLFEAARAYAAADERLEVSLEDVKKVALLALRLRGSTRMLRFLREQKDRDQEVLSLIDGSSAIQKDPGQGASS